MSRAFSSALFPTAIVVGIFILFVGSSPALFALPVVAVVAYVVIALLLYVLR